MNLSPRLLVLVLLAVLTGCGEHSGDTLAVNPFMPPPIDIDALPRPQPRQTGPCPYLDTEAVERANQQRVSLVRQSRHDPYPACFFYRADGRELAAVWIYSGDTGTAGAIVNKYAPMKVSDWVRINDWRGNIYRGETGSAFAIKRAGSAIIVTSAQPDGGHTTALAEELTALPRL